QARGLADVPRRQSRLGVTARARERGRRDETITRRVDKDGERRRLRPRCSRCRLNGRRDWLRRRDRGEHRVVELDAVRGNALLRVGELHPAGADLVVSPLLDAVLLERAGSAGEPLGPEVLRITRVTTELERDEMVFLEIARRVGRVA